MKQHHLKKERQIKLPVITSKTSSSFSSDTNIHSRVRPSSSSKVSDLEKNLFAQLDQYEDLDKKVKKGKFKQVESVSSKQLGTDWMNIDAPYLKKLEKMLPDTYMKLLEGKPQPLHENNKGVQKVVEKQKQKKPKNKQQNSFAVAQREVDQIFQRYLKEQGLGDMKQTKSDDLKELNNQINATEADINSIRKNMFELINKFSNECLNDQ